MNFNDISQILLWKQFYLSLYPKNSIDKIYGTSYLNAVKFSLTLNIYLFYSFHAFCLTAVSSAILRMSQRKNIRNFIRGCHKCYPRDKLKCNIAIKTSMIFRMYIMNHEGFYRNYFEENINVYLVYTSNWKWHFATIIDLYISIFI